MSEIIFIEGVSGVGKSTLVKNLRERLRACGYLVRSYAEFDFTNPIDFYSTAYIPNGRYRELCRDHPEQADRIRRYSVPAGAAVLVRYFDGDTPLFSESFLGELCEMEFCYNPPHPVPLAEYSDAYRAVWESFAGAVDGAVDFYIFDGSLLHHPLNDMIRNYGATKEQAAAHVAVLLRSLDGLPVKVFYLFAQDIESRLRLARRDRGQTPPDDGAVSFWKKRREYDEYVLKRSAPAARVMDVTKYGYGNVTDSVAASVTA